MNSLVNREWEVYNFDQIGGSTEYDNILINKDIDNYFNELISKPVPTQTNIMAKSSYNFEKFYFDYIEHNLLFIVLLIGIIIFLIIRHYVKDFDSFTSNPNNIDKEIITDTTTNNKIYNEDNENDEDDENNKNDNKTNNNKSKQKTNKTNQIKRKQQIEKIKLINYKKQLDKEKEKILSIIDELSNINDYENLKYKQYPNYLGQDININYSNNYLASQHFFNQAYPDIQKDAHNFDENSQYYDVNKNFNDKTNEIDGIYIEPPFN